MAEILKTYDYPSYHSIIFRRADFTKKDWVKICRKCSASRDFEPDDILSIAIETDINGSLEVQVVAKKGALRDDEV